MNLLDIQGPAPRLALIDDDEDFRRLATSLAKGQGIRLETFTSMTEILPLTTLEQFDVVILDHHLEHLTGLEIARLIDTFASDVPVLLISSENPGWVAGEGPECILGFMSKASGISSILKRAVLLHERQKLLKRYST